MNAPPTNLKSPVQQAESPAIRTEAISKTFGTFIAVDNVDLEVHQGENFALLGPNGAGKSTFIRMLTTLTALSSGKAEVAGHDVTLEPDAVRAAIGVVPQAMTSDPDLTAQENLDFYARLYSVPYAQRRALSEELLTAVDLLPWRDKPVGTFSGGMRRRLEVARSLMHRPRILFLDEPTTGLDPASRLAMWDMIRQLKAQTQLTLLLTTHYMEEAEQLCDRVAIFDHGCLVALGSPAELQAGIPEVPPIEVRFDWTPTGWTDLLAALPSVTAVEERSGLWRLRSSDRLTAVAALLACAHQQGVGIVSLVARSHTLEDVFIQYTGSELRDAAGKHRFDVSHLYERPARY